MSPIIWRPCKLLASAYGAARIPYATYVLTTFAAKTERSREIARSSAYFSVSTTRSVGWNLFAQRCRKSTRRCFTSRNRRAPASLQRKQTYVPCRASSDLRGKSGPEPKYMMVGPSLLSRAFQKAALNFCVRGRSASACSS